MSQGFRDALHEILAMLRKRDKREFFCHPVDSSIVTDYYTVVRFPMDLSTMERKVDQGAYSDFESFEADVMLIISNCRLYNARDTVYVKCASALEAWWQKSRHRLASLVNDSPAARAADKLNRQMQNAAYEGSDHGGADRSALNEESSSHVGSRNSSLVGTTDRPSHLQQQHVSSSSSRLDSSGLPLVAGREGPSSSSNYNFLYPSASSAASSSASATTTSMPTSAHHHHHHQLNPHHHHQQQRVHEFSSHHSQLTYRPHAEAPRGSVSWGGTSSSAPTTMSSAMSSSSSSTQFTEVLSEQQANFLSRQPLPTATAAGNFQHMMQGTFTGATGAQVHRPPSLSETMALPDGDK